MRSQLFILVLAVAYPTFAQTNTPATTNAVRKVPLSDIGQRTVILGELGRPIGEEVTIHGHKWATPHMGAFNFQVDTLNGEVLTRPVNIMVRGIRKWPGNTEAKIRGYEVGTIRFEHIDDFNWGPDDPRFKTRQIILMSFEPLEIIEPKSLKIGS